MARITVEEHKEFTLLPAESILLLKIEECTVKDAQGRNGTWEKLEFKFKILGVQAVGDGGNPQDYAEVIGGPIWGSVPFKITESPENKLNQWANAILGLEVSVGYELDTDHFINREVRGVTSQYDKRSINQTTGQPYKSHQVDALLPKAPGPAQQQPQYAQPQQQYQQPPQQPQYAQPQQQAYQQPAQPQYAQQAPPAQDPWATPAQPQDPWGAPGVGSDDPPF